MKKILLLMCFPLLLPLAAQADVSVDINVPGVSLHLGIRTVAATYWDGYDWRPPQWWHAHQGRGLGERNARGMYWDGGRWQLSPPRGYDHREPARSGNRSAAIAIIATTSAIMTIGGKPDRRG